MKTQKRHLVILLFFSALFLWMGLNNVLLAQSYTARFNLALQNVCFSSNGYCDYMNEAGQWCDHNGAILTGPRFQCTSNGKFEIFDNPDAANSPATGEHRSTHHVVIIQTANTNPTGAVNTGYTYNITLEWVNIDNSVNIITPAFSNAKSPMNLGDDCVNVVLTLVGNNYLTAPVGAAAALEYNRYDGTASPYLGTYGNRSLTINGSGNLTATKPSYVNNGSVIGSKQYNSTTDCISNGHIIFNGTGTITAQVTDPTSSGSSADPNTYNIIGSYGAAIGGAANCRCGNITIKSGTVNAYANTTAAAIGSGGGLTGFGADVSGIIKITGGTVNTYNRDWTTFTSYGGTYTNTETGVGIGAGSSNANTGGTFRSGAKVEISDGTVNVYKRLVTYGQAPPAWSRGNIGGGNSNTGGGETAYAGGAAVVEIYGGTVTAANIGGGSANKAGANGGNATVTLKMEGGSLNVSGTIGGGSSVSGTGGQATINVYAPDNGTAGTVTAGTIGGGNSQSGAGGQATVNVFGGSLSSGSIGGGNSTNASTTAAGGLATVNVSGGKLTVTGKIGGGKSFGSGAGGNALIHVSGGTLSCQSIGGGDSQSGRPGSVYNNSLTDAGVFIEDGTLTTGTIGGGSRLSGTAAYGKASVKITGGTIQGQCLMVATGTSDSDHCWFQMTGGTIDNTGLGGVNTGTYPRAKAQGGAVYMEDSNGTVSISGGTIQNCTGSTMGGAVYMTHGSFSLTGSGKIQDCSASASGGAVHLADGTVTIDGGSVGTIVSSTAHPNSAPQGGGIYLGDGRLNVISGTISYNTASSQGGGAYLNAGILSMTGGTITHNQAANGGGIYVYGGTSTISNGDITYNTATTSGGGIYAYNGSLTFSNGSINYNLANTTGGGIYVDTDGTLYLKGTATLSKNRVPTDQKGGGVYLLGKVIIGDNSETPSTILAQDNFAYTTSTPDTYTPTATTRNNIYLPSPTVNTDHKDVITVVKNGLSTSTRVGFSVPGNFVPVIYCDENSPYTYLESFLTPVASDGMKETVFDDAEKYHTMHFTFNPYDAQHIYLSSGTWVEQVTSQPSGFSVSGDDDVTISSEEGLAWLIRYINGISPVTQANPGVNVTLTKDLNMGAYPWVPMASKAYSSTSTDVPFTGTFDGQGHVIANIDLQWLGAQTGTDLGLFGNVGTGGTVKNVTLKDASITTSDMTYTDGAAALGSIAGRTSGGTVMNCTASATLTTTNTKAVLGGLVGQIASGTVHSSYALPKLTGYQMGGLAGSNSGNLYNSFANPQFTYSGAANAYFVGGLVAVNTGQVENCYVRLSRTPQGLTGAKFGMLAGSNSGTNTIVQCYGPDGAADQFHHSYTYLYNNDATGLSNCDLYKKVDAPYLYNRPNDNLVGSTGKTLTVKLNEWVSSKIKTIADLAYWKRSTAGGYSYTYNRTTYTGGNINDDYPIHKMKELACAASPDGLFIEYRPDLGSMLTKYNGISGGGTVWLYASPKNDDGTDERVNVDNDSYVLLYIDEDATLLQAANNSLTAYTSQTLKVETESRWHFISSSLGNSDIGFNYGTTSQVNFSWSENPCNVTFNGNNDDALFPIDMPNINKVDLYAFYEPEYHWLNLKRNTNSHWHMNATTTPIAYNGNGTGGNGNETYLIPGKGYLASIDKDQLLQNNGTLNNGAGTVTVQDVTYHEANAWAGLLGYNLLGNPYQSYLDFNAFITDAANSGLNASKGNAEPTYAVYDPEIGSYIQYKSGSSKGSRSADGMIHPHQGFMIRRTGGSYSATATFKNTMRSTNSTSPFRGEQPAFPLVNLTVTDDEGNADVAVLELGRDADRGAEKLRANTCKGWLYLHYDNDDYGILFRSEVEDYQPLWFEASEAGTYTMRWETANGEFESLTLVDNITGVVTDMLATDSYVFEANPDQYKSRFKIVIGDYKDIEENEGGASTSSATDEIFAYYANGEIHLVETQNFASLQIVDMMGRVILSRDGVHTVSANGIVPGVYVLRLTTDKGTKIQKMVIE